MAGKAVADPSETGQDCQVSLYQGMLDMTITSDKALIAWISPRFWTHGQGNLVLPVLFAVLVPLGSIYSSFKIWCRHLEAPEPEENSKTQPTEMEIIKDTDQSKIEEPKP